MTPAQEQYKGKLIKLIHSNKRKKFIDDDLRIEFMKSRFNCDSLKLMSINQLKQFLDYCQDKIKDIPIEEPISDAQRYKIVQSWDENKNVHDTSIRALNSFIERLTGITSYTNLTKTQATKVIIAISKI